MWTGTVCRALWSSVRSARALRGMTSDVTARRVTSVNRTSRTCVVDPNSEEQFVFADLIEQETESQEPVLTLPEPPRPPSQRLHTLQRQMKALEAVSEPETPNKSIQFQDSDFPLDPDLVASKRKKKPRKGEQKIFGTPDVDEPLSDTPCSGCGALLHCTAMEVPGYLPSQKFKVLVQEESLDSAICQRCFLLTHHQKALSLQMSSEDYRKVVQQIKDKKALVLLIVDLLDIPDSIIPDLPELVGSNKKVFVLGNKIDAVPCDAPNYLKRIKQLLTQHCHDAGFGGQLTDVHLISAKTGYGIEGLISSLQASWKYKGDVYLVGGANSGKSTLFNTLLESDYCKSRASDVISKATISPWPGTTLNLLQFPIINPTPHRMFRRQQRLQNEVVDQEPSKLLGDRYLSGHVGRTFRTEVSGRHAEIDFDPDSLAFSEQEDGRGKASAVSRSPEPFTHNELKDAHWLFDTPGILKQNDLLAILNEQEVKMLLPTRAIVPRTFVLKPGMSLFVGGVARVDLLQAGSSCWFSVMASLQIPVHVTSMERADEIYQKHLGHKLLGVPTGGAERVETFPRLVSQELQMQGKGPLEAGGDITLSSAGWVAVTAGAGELLQLRVHSPEGVKMGLRTLPLLPYIVSLKGQRIKKTPSYKTKKPKPLTGL